MIYSDPTIDDALEDEYYRLPDASSIDELPTHKKYFEAKEIFNQTFVKKRYRDYQKRQ